MLKWNPKGKAWPRDFFAWVAEKSQNNPPEKVGNENESALANGILNLYSSCLDLGDSYALRMQKHRIVNNHQYDRLKPVVNNPRGVTVMVIVNIIT
jgi:hypothetical protein